MIMNDEFQLVISTLCQTITIDGEAVDVEIYRGAHDKTWTLELVDAFGNSTIWDDEFDTDSDALKEVLKTIEEEGIEALLGEPSEEQIIDRKLRRLDDIFCSDIAPESAMDAATLEGFFTALILGPYVIPPSQMDLGHVRWQGKCRLRLYGAG